jgi:hypothetical protein
MQSQHKPLRPSRVAAAVASTLALCSASAFASPSVVRGVVGGALFTPPVFADTPAASSPASTVASVYAGATVCFDLNGNGACDPGEPSTTTSGTGSFQLSSATLAPLVAQISTSATNGGSPITSRNVFRVNVAQIQAATINPLLPATVNITPLSTEVTLAIENQGVSYSTAVDNLAQRIGVASADVLKAPTQVTDSTEVPAILKESVIAQGRLQLAAKFVDRGDTVGELRGNFDCPNTASFDPTNANACTGSDLNTVAIPAAQEYAFNLEGMPQYDYVFVIIEENESQSSIQGNTKAPYINSFISKGSTFWSYFSTGDPSEPNYLALGGADDWGQNNDEAIPYPAITGVQANLWNSIDAAGLSWHVYEGSLYPSPAGTTQNVSGATLWNQASGGLWFDNPAESTIAGANGGGTYAGSLRAMKHNPAVWYADAASQPDFALNSRSVSGAYGTTDVNGNAIPYTYASINPGTGINLYTEAGDWDASLQSYATTNNITSWWTANTQPWVQDQFKQDLQNGTVANYNFIVPDQDDDMHNNGVAARPDYWAQNIVTKIQSSALWNDPTKRVAIVITFDEGEAATTSCCGWNPERAADGKAQLVTFSATGTETSSAAALQSFTEAYKGTGGTTTTTFNPPAYSLGNHGHAVTLFGLYTNQQALGNAPAGNYDTDYYSHFSFVRTLQDIFGLADPGLPGTYMNRSKFTETFIQQNATVLPEFAGSANPHFDAVRAMNHVYAFPNGVSRTGTTGGLTPPTTTGPDPTQVNLWATHN